jgi:serine protease Do
VNILIPIVIAAYCIPHVALAADNLRLTGSQHWLTIASLQDKDVAIGIARYAGTGAQVVSSQSGYYAVVLGPYEANTIAELKRKNNDLPELPRDALLSRGANYLTSVWKAPAQFVFLVGYEISKPAHLSSGDLSVELKLEKVAEDQYATVVTGTEKNGPSFTFKVNEDGVFTAMTQEAGLLKLDPALATPQVVFTRYSGGAHCCTNTWIAEKPNNAAGWSLIDTGQLDGGGYSFEDVDGDGGLELLSVDNSFLYAFDSYADSVAPLHISKLRDGKIEDVSDADAMRGRLKQDLAGIEFTAKLHPEMWKSNGFLAGWAASKMRLGQGDEAWQTVTQNIDINSDFGPQECTSGQKIEDCPAEKLKPVPVLKALASFLKEGGYGPLPQAAEQLVN